MPRYNADTTDYLQRQKDKRAALRVGDRVTVATFKDGEPPRSMDAHVDDINAYRIRVVEKDGDTLEFTAVTGQRLGRESGIEGDQVFIPEEGAYLAEYLLAYQLAITVDEVAAMNISGLDARIQRELLAALLSVRNTLRSVRGA